ncbi:MAG TPA: HAD family hydrolase [Acidobacteriaceae bacterium]|nr:HAD family hydrolase [Acidobacteriaceae bacterium]
MSLRRRGLSRPWDGFDVYLFDIDGTLLHCADAVHYFAFCDALQAIAGRPLTLEGVTAHGNTDVGILRDALALAGVEDAAWRPNLPAIQEQMCCFVRGREQEICAEAMPFAAESLERLRSRGALLGVATGNLRGIGELKLRRCGLWKYFSFAGWSDRWEHRADVFAAAAAEARAVAGTSASICVVGDTPADIAAARYHNLAIIAVATGVYSIAELNAGEPDLCVKSLKELVDGPAEATGLAETRPSVCR